MGEASLWERGRVARSDVPTLQEAFAWCDHGMLVRAVVEDFALPDQKRGSSSPARRHAMERRTSETLDSLLRMDVKRRKGRDLMLLPAASFSLSKRGDAMVRGVGMRLLALDDAPIAAGMLGEAPGGSREEALPRRSCALEPWERLLASRVWLGGPWSVGDRHRALAGAFWGMTYFGYTIEDVVAGQERWSRRGDGPARPEDEARSDADADAALGLRALSSDAAEYRAKRAEELELFAVDQLDLDRGRALSGCVDALNREAELDLARRFVQALQRTGRLAPDVTLVTG